MKHASIVVTAEHCAPLYPTEEIAKAKTGNKSGSGHDNRWAVWKVVGDDVELIAFNLPTLSAANEQALALAKDIRNTIGRDEWEEMRTRIIRT